MQPIDWLVGPTSYCRWMQNIDSLSEIWTSFPEETRTDLFGFMNSETNRHRSLTQTDDKLLKHHQSSHRPRPHVWILTLSIQNKIESESFSAAADLNVTDVPIKDPHVPLTDRFLFSDWTLVKLPGTLSSIDSLKHHAEPSVYSLPQKHSVMHRTGCCLAQQEEIKAKHSRPLSASHWFWKGFN